MNNDVAKTYLESIKKIINDPFIDSIDDLRMNLNNVVLSFEQHLEELDDDMNLVMIPSIIKTASDYEIKIKGHNGITSYIKTERLFNLFDYDKRSQEFIDNYLLTNIRFLTYKKRNDYFSLPHLLKYLRMVYHQPQKYNERDLFEKIKGSLLNAENKPLFCRQSDMNKLLGISNTGSLRIRIKHFNKVENFPIVPFIFQAEGMPDKVFYLRSDAERLVAFCKRNI